MNYANMTQENLEYRQLKEYIEWLHSKADYIDFDCWCQIWAIDNENFTLDELFDEIDIYLAESYTYAGIQKIISDTYKAFINFIEGDFISENDLNELVNGNVDVINNNFVVIDNFEQLICTYIEEAKIIPQLTSNMSGQYEEWQRLKEFNATLILQPDFSEFNRWLLAKMQKQCLTFKQVKKKLYDYAVSKNGKFSLIIGIVSKWYKQFHEECGVQKFI